jgi:hypothetical protein
MPDGFDLSADIAPVAALVNAVGSESELASKRSQLDRSQERAKQAIREYVAELDSLYEDIRRSGHTSDWILQAAAIIRRRELTERERLNPGLDVLRQKLFAYPLLEPSDARKVLEESIAIAEAWLALPAALHEKLIALAAGRRAAANKIRRAQPVEGAMESTELTRKIIARFPKILAELAK